MSHPVLLEYVRLYRVACDAKDRADEALIERQKAENEKQIAWRAVSALRNQRIISEGAYMVDGGVVIIGGGDYPDVHPFGPV